jgi:prepilin-type N-terminal cleavage/methylation domain-containing protein
MMQDNRASFIVRKIMHHAFVFTHSPIYPFTNKNGFTLIELIIATTIILIVSLGFFGWASTIIQTNLSIERNNTAYAMAMDVAERLQRMSDNTLIQPRGTNKRCVGFDGSGNLRGCSTADCGGGTPTGPLGSGQTGMTIYTNPLATASALPLYKGTCSSGQSWLDCKTNALVNTAANSYIDHPNSNTGTPNYDSINPIRSYKNTTYYAVWSVAYMPCTSYSTDRRKIFITVYWLDPEPAAATAASALSSSTVKSVSIVVDKAIGTES